MITFTEKSGAEMKERVARMIRERLDSETDSQKRERLLELRERLSSAQISTIHAFVPGCCANTPWLPALTRIFPFRAICSKICWCRTPSTMCSKRWTNAPSTATFRRKNGTNCSANCRPTSCGGRWQCCSANPTNPNNCKKTGCRKRRTDVRMAGIAVFILLERHVGTAALLHDLLPIIREILSAKVERSRLKDGGKTAFQLFDEVLVNDASTASRLLLWQQLLTLSVLMTTNDATAYKRDLRPIGVKADLGEAFEPLKTSARPLCRWRNLPNDSAKTRPAISTNLVCTTSVWC